MGGRIYMDETRKIPKLENAENEAKEIILTVYQALKKKGYNPISQLVGYILSGDPTYITSHDGARALIRKIERDELLEELVRFYVSKK
ncbi:MAG: IreB family regulatory phosphoprotein [Clostridiaceae bacterium]|jgi:uncharacterized protein (UPF0297 family)|nr:IreB family regulatory phosphoprotein [Clostridiaceae bacterium]